jgi:hypothetical protein
MLTPWLLSVYNPRKNLGGPFAGGGVVYGYGREGSVSETRRTLVVQQCDASSVDMGFGDPDMLKRTMLVASKGDINASFIVPGLISVPSDGASHNVTVCELALDSVMSWVSVPKKNSKAHLTVCSRVRSLSRITPYD